MKIQLLRWVNCYALIDILTFKGLPMVRKKITYKFCYTQSANQQNRTDCAP